MRILVFSDSATLSSVLKSTLTKAGYAVTAPPLADEALDEAVSGIYDAAVFAMPESSFASCLRRLRSEGCALHIVFLSGAPPAGRAAALDAGADCCLSLPLSPEELLAQLRALLRRRGEALSSVPAFGDLTLDMSSGALCCGEAKIRLSATELELMRLLLLNGESLVSKETLLVKVWGYNSDVEASIVETYISFLRKKLRSIGSLVGIETLWSRGYHLRFTQH